MRRLLARRTWPSEAGTTVLELVVVMALLAIVLPVAYQAVISMQTQESITTNRFAAEAEAQTIADRIGKDLRTAVAPTPTGSAFASADVNDVTFFASLADPAGPTKLHAFVLASPGPPPVNFFHEDQTTPDATSTPGNYTYTGAAQSRIDGRYLDTNAPIFSYYDRNGNPLTTPITLPGVLRTIESVGVSLTVHVTPTSPAVTIQTRIHVRNVDYNPS